MYFWSMMMPVNESNNQTSETWVGGNRFQLKVFGFLIGKPRLYTGLTAGFVGASLVAVYIAIMEKGLEAGIVSALVTSGMAPV